MQLKRNAAIPVMALLALAAPVWASNIVVNGDFEGTTYTGPNNDIVPTGWLLGPPSYSTQSRLNVESTVDPSNDLAPESGSNYVAFQSIATSGKDCLYQDLTTVAGMSYDVSFWVAITTTSVGNNVTFDPVWDEQGSNYAHMTSVLNPPSNTGPTGYTEYTFTEVASGTTTRIDFHGVDTNGAVLLDNVVVDNGVSDAPEPGTLVIAGSALLLAEMIRRHPGKKA